MATVSAGMLCAQSAGSLKDAAIPAINPMDPDGNGFITSTGVAFTGPLDETEFELPFLPIQQLETEPDVDNKYAAGCEFYELINDATSGADAAYYYYSDPDGIADNGDELIFFRFRVARFSNGATAFSIFIDADYRFGFAGLEADPNAVSGNPGFETEIAVYNSTGLTGGVRVFDVDGMDTATVVSYNASIQSNYQVSYALNQASGCIGHSPVFVDMFVPFSALGIAASTQIRMAAAVNEDINSSLGGGASDIGGIDGNALVSNDDQFIKLISNYSPIHVINPANQAPSALDASVNVAENAQNETVVHTVLATDANVDVLTYSITGGNDLSAFTINSATGELSVMNSAGLDFETSPTIVLLVSVSDGSLYDNAVITINLANVNESPVGVDASVTVAENTANGSSVHFVEAVDPDANTVLNYSITAGNSEGVFAINSSSGEITVNDNTLLDYENPVTFTLHVQVSDAVLTDDAMVTIAISDVNESPFIVQGQFSVDENASAGTAVYTVEATDPDEETVFNFSIIDGNTDNAFSMDNLSGAIKVNNSAALDFESTPVFALGIRVSDGNLFTDAITGVNIKDINEPPVIHAASVTLESRVSNDDVIHTLTANDPDVDDVVSYSIETGNEDGFFEVLSQTGEVIIEDAETLNLRVRTFDLVVVATDSKGLTGKAVLQITMARIPDRNDIQPQKGFSPNGDGNNDTWRITGIEAFPDNVIKIFNRWGVSVYEAVGYDNDRVTWRGEGKGTNDVESTYFFIINAGDFEPLTGYVIVKP